MVRRERDDAIVWVVLDRPDRRNALNRAMVEALRRALIEADADPETQVIAVRGEGPDFCAGGDLAEIRRLAEEDVLLNLDDADALADLFLLPRRLRKPVAAVVHGRALAGGCGLATACDLVLAAETAEFGYPEVHLGFVPAMVLALLRRHVGEKAAFALVAFGDRLSATEAQRLGLVTATLPADDFVDRARVTLRRLASHSAAALRLLKRVFYLQDGLSLEAAVHAGADINVMARLTDDARAGMRRFLERT
jgi:methylglutaconyl-CoA hydratase